MAIKLKFPLKKGMFVISIGRVISLDPAREAALVAANLAERTSAPDNWDFNGDGTPDSSSGEGGGAGTDLALQALASTLQLQSSTGDGVTLPAATSAAAGVMTALQVQKLTALEVAVQALVNAAAPAPAPTPAPAPAGAKPRFGVGSATFYNTPAASLAAMTEVPGSVAGGKAGTVTLTTTAGNYGWFATTNSGTPAFTDMSNSLQGGWQLIGNNSDGTNTWYWWRMDYPNAAPSGKTFSVA